jgi:hypothetical protein
MAAIVSAVPVQGLTTVNPERGILRGAGPVPPPPLPTAPTMGPLDAIDHLLNLLLPALVTGALAAAFAKLLWRRELAGRAWARLAGWAAAAGVVALVGSLVVVGADGRMLGYAAMVAAQALALTVAGWRR